MTNLETYNKLYNNAAYRNLSRALVADICGEYQAAEPALLERAEATPDHNRLMNAVTDCAIEASMYYDYPDGMVPPCVPKLVKLLAESGASQDAVQATADYIERFESTYKRNVSDMVRERAGATVELVKVAKTTRDMAYNISAARELNNARELLLLAAQMIELATKQINE